MANVGYSPAAAAIDSRANRWARSVQLRELSGALQNLAKYPPEPEAARKWANVDLFAAFLSEDPGRDEAGWPARVWAAIDTAVQVLVFVPILLTWIGLTSAAFADRNSQSLLQTWQTGRMFGVSFHLVALYTACIVFLLIAGTVALIIHRKQLERDDADLRAKLAEALTWADLELAPVRLGITDRVAQEMGDMADKLVQTADAIEAAGVAAVVAQQQATAAVTAAVPALASVDAAATASRDAAAELGRTPGALKPHLTELTEAANNVAKAERDLVAASAASSKQVASALGASGRDLADASAASTKQIASALGASGRDLADASAASTKQIASALGASGRDLADASAASTKQIAETLAGGASGVRDSLGEVTSAAAWSASRAEVAADILGQAQHALIGLPGAVAELRTGVGDIGSQIMNLTDAIKAAGGAADRLLAAVQQQSASAEPELQTDPSPDRWPDLKSIDGQGGPNPPWNQQPRSK